ncbi:hypothetical protein HMPREF0298_1788, partial [Corynebacterium lipophiloflavum DSM 44291]
VSRELSGGVGADMSEIAVVVIAVEGLKALPTKDLVQLGQRPRPAKPFVMPINRTHELVD